MSLDGKSIDYQALLKNAYTALDDMQTRVESLEQSAREPIAIVGVGCRFPGGADNAQAFWQVLLNGMDTVTEVPPERWDVDEYYDPDPDAPGKYYTRSAAFIKDIDQFDADFFRISPREAVSMDPKQRLLMEVAWEALEDAGLASKKIFGSQTGVFIGVSSYDYLYMQSKANDPTVFDAYSSTGVAYSIAAGRLSYFFDFHGPNAALDTACSSSLVATHLACQSLRMGECDAALAGGVNLVLIPEGMITISRARMVSFDGHCKAFDASADGYVRGEGCGIVVLKRLSDAVANGDRILAVILGTAINQDGRSNGLTAPNGLAQEAVIRAALANAAVKPGDVSYIEAHGTGTSLGDPIELRALDAVYGKAHSPENPFYVGSVKTNIGHLEGGAGVAGLIKLVLSLQHKVIPPHLHYHTPNPHIPWDQIPVVIPTQPVDWVPHNGSRLIAGLSSFGYSGTNAHIIVAEAPQPEQKTAGVERSHHLLSLAGKNEGALKELAGRYARYLSENQDIPFADICYTANTGRFPFGERLALVAHSSEQAQAQLAGWLSGETPAGLLRGSAQGDTSPDVVFLFTGQGAQYAGMGRQLYATQPVFRKTLDQCAEILRPYLTRPLLSVLYPENEVDAALIDQTAYTQPALFAIEYALAQLWSSWGVEPAVALGHSVGEFVAACLAGVFGLEDGLKLIATRGRLMQELPAGGSMAAVFASEDRVAAALRPYTDRVSIAAVNGPDNVVVSGAASAVQAVLDDLQAEGVRSKPLVVSHAFHSPLMDPILETFAQAAASITYSQPQIGLVSNLTGKLVQGNTVTNAAYWQSHVRAAVRFADSMQSLAEHGYRLFLEIGPQPTLLGMGRRCLPEVEAAWLPSLRSGRDDEQQMLESLAGLYTAGINIDWDGFDRNFSRRRVVLPNYPFQRQRFWVNLSPDSPTSARKAKDNNAHPLLDQRLRSPLFEGTLFESGLSTTSPAFLNDHRFFGTPLFPAAGYLEMGLAGALQVYGAGSHAVTELSIQEALILPEDKTCTVQSAISPVDRETADFQVYSQDESANGSWKLHTTGKIRLNRAVGVPPAPFSLAEIRARCAQEVSLESYYQGMSDLGAEYGPAFRGITGLWQGDGEALGRLELPQAIRREAEAFQLHPALLDAGFQILGAAFPDAGDSTPENNVYVPVGLESYQVYRTGYSQLWGLATLRNLASGRMAETFSGDLALFDEHGQPVAQVTGLQFRKVRRADIWRAVQKRFDEWLYEIEWQPRPVELPSAAFASAGIWLIFADGGGTGSSLADRLRGAGAECVLVRPGSAYLALPDGEWQIDPGCPEDFHRLLQDALHGRQLPFQGIVHLWSLDSAEESSLPAIHAGLKRVNGSVLHLVQALAARSEAQALESNAGRSTAGQSTAGRFWLVTRGAQPAGSSSVNPAQAPLWGLANTIAAEHPELGCIRLDLDPAGATGDAGVLFQEIAAAGDEDQVAWRGQERFVARFVQLTLQDKHLHIPVDSPFELDMTERGILDNLVIRTSERRSPGPGEVEIRVKASGLNFRDVLNALGMYPGPAGPIGTECAGIITRVGQGVSQYSIGDEVIALGTGTFKSHVVTSVDLVFPKPPQFSFAKAATIPITFLTAYYGLYILAKIKPGDRVLIHAAAGGVGIAAVQLARRAGAVIFGTAGSPEKRSFLKSIGVEYVMSSRTLDFAAEVMEFTQGEGVDIVLNALADDFIPKSLSVLADHGRFLEIGKRGIWDKSQVAELNPTLEYYAYDLTQVLVDDPGFVSSTLAELMPEFESGQLEPLPLHTFSMQEVVEAFRFMAQARHTGKIVITQADDSLDPDFSNFHPDALYLPDATYLITGGLGGLGLAIARGMVQRGARHLVLMGRSAPSDAARKSLAEWEEMGARVIAAQGDVSREQDVSGVLEQIEKHMPPLRGIIHAAGILDDGVLTGQTWPRFEAVMAPKIDGAWHLHTLTRHKPVDFFVLFSSIAAIFGSSGQGNYAAANAFLDALAHYRHAYGLRATSINWGPWSEVGMAAVQSKREHQRWGTHGVTTIAPDEGAQVFDRLLFKKRTQLSVYPMDWARLANQVGEKEIQPFLRDLVHRSNGQEDKKYLAAPPEILQILQDAAPEERYDLLMEHTREQVTRVLGLDPSQTIDPQRGLTDLGLDSLMTVELSNRLKLSFGRPLPATLAFEYPTISALTDYLAKEVLSLTLSSEAPAAMEQDASSQEEGMTELEQMTEEEVEETLLQELDDIGF